MNENSRQTPFNLVLKVLVKISAYLCTENNFGNPTTVFRKRKPQRTKKQTNRKLKIHPLFKSTRVAYMQQNNVLLPHLSVTLLFCCDKMSGNYVS